MYNCTYISKLLISITQNSKYGVIAAHPHTPHIQHGGSAGARGGVQTVSHLAGQEGRPS